MLTLVINQLGVFTEYIHALCTRCVLELEHGFRVEQVVLTVAPPLILATPLKVGVLNFSIRVRIVMAFAYFRFDNVKADTPDAGSGKREIFINECLVQSYRLEDLRAAIRLDRRDTHLRHYFNQALVDGLDVVLHRRIERCLSFLDAVDLLDHLALQQLV